MSHRSRKLALLVAIVVPSLASAQPISSRSALNSMLISSITETFSGFSNLAPGEYFDIPYVILDANSSFPGFGRALIGPENIVGHQQPFTGFPFPDLRINAGGPGYPPSISGIYGFLSISFINCFLPDCLYPVTGFGSDGGGTASFFGPGGVLLGTTDGTQGFIGWQDSGGIERVDFYGGNITNITFGLVSPEPASIMLLFTGLVAIGGVTRRRRTA